jgi:hypothetical protein
MALTFSNTLFLHHHLVHEFLRTVYINSYIQNIPTHMAFIMHTLYINQLDEACSNTVQQVLVLCKHTSPTK